MSVVPKFLIFSAFIMVFNLNVYAQVKTNAFKLFFERVYLHTDRDLYTQGDTIWYKAYLLNAQNNQPIGTSGNLYVELIAQDSINIMSREIIRLDYGAGNGDFALGDSIPSGKYTLRAYTNWMRNFGDNFIFEKELTIINTSVKQPVVSALIPVSRKAPKTEVAKAQTPVKVSIVRFYPESGSLVESISSLIAVKAENSFGKGIPASGAILNSSGDTITRFSCDTLGMGKLLLLPIQGQVYHAVVNTKEHKNMNASFPSALTKGFTLRVSHPDSLINVIINCNDAQLAEAKGKTFTLTGKHGGKICFSKPIQITDSQLLIKVPDSIFPDGIAAITLSDGQNKPHCERLVYVHHTDNNTLIIQTDKTAYQSKEKVTVHIKTNVEKANLSMAVVDAGVVPVQAENIESYLMLRSELQGGIEQPNRYFDTTNVNRYKQLDLLLMTQGWRDFVWRRLADSAIRITYKAEDGFDVSGRVRQRFGNHPINNMNITLTAFKAVGNKLYAARTDSIGKYYINGLQLYGPQAIKLTARDDKGKRDGWLLMDSLYNNPMPIGKLETKSTIDTGMAGPMKKRQTELRDIAIKAEGKQLREVKITAKRKVIVIDGLESLGGLITFGYPDEIYNIKAKDLEYKTVEWYLLQNCPAAKQDIDYGLVFIMFGKRIRAPFIVNQKYDPYLPRDLILSLGLDKVTKIVVRHLVTMTGADFFVIYITTLPGPFDNKDFGAEIANVNGYYEARTFYKPLYDGKNDTTKPDLRTTIHWEPNITTDAKGEATVTYYNADPKSKLRIIVQGITDKGVPVATVAGYVVK